MLPALNDDGYLPPGIHNARLDEIESRFGKRPELRQVQMQSLRWLGELAQRAGIVRFVLGGSFVTDIDEPNDVDCVLLPGKALNQALEDEFAAGFPFLQIVMAEQDDFDYFVRDFFAADRRGVARGLVEVTL